MSEKLEKKSWCSNHSPYRGFRVISADPALNLSFDNVDVRAAFVVSIACVIQIVFVKAARLQTIGFANRRLRNARANGVRQEEFDKMMTRR